MLLRLFLTILFFYASIALIKSYPEVFRRIPENCLKILYLYVISSIYVVIINPTCDLVSSSHLRKFIRNVSKY